ncbi:MAG: O-antigen ligase family protein, partial [Devosia sp.]|nr:O-antigen ligase family protein [Devosia sp.]
MRAAVTAFADRWGARVILALTLVLCGVAGLITPYVLGVIGVLLLLWKATDGTLWQAYRTPAARAFAVVFVVLLICFAVTAKSPRDVLYVFNFVMLILFAPFYSALERRSTSDGGLIVARLALVGALLSVAVSLVMLAYFGPSRRDHGLIGVIVLSNTSVLLGFLSLLGVAADHGPRRWMYLLGPVAGVAVALITHSRGPLIAILPLGVIGAIFVGRSLKVGWPLVAAGLVAALAVVAAWVVSLGGRMAQLPHILWGLLSGDRVADHTTASRLDLYQAAWQAFLHSPIVGHGWAHLMEAVTPFLHDPTLAKLPQLHNDMADFAVAAGLVGVLCYVALLLTPVV